MYWINDRLFVDCIFGNFELTTIAYIFAAFVFAGIAKFVIDAFDEYRMDEELEEA